MSEEKNKSADAVAERKLLLAKKDEHQKNLKEAKDEYASASESVKANEQSLAKAEKELKAATKELGDMQKELAATTQKESALSQALATVRGKVEQAKQAGKESQSQTAIHAALLEGSRSKILTGFCGKLGDLGSIDAKYDVAVSTACPQLNYYVGGNHGGRSEGC